MRVPERTVMDALVSFFAKCEIARKIGIPMSEVFEGRPVPDGWRLDPMTEYFLPPNVELFTPSSK